jgi:hypothetical protein
VKRAKKRPQAKPAPKVVTYEVLCDEHVSGMGRTAVYRVNEEELRDLEPESTANSFLYGLPPLGMNVERGQRLRVTIEQLAPKKGMKPEANPFAIYTCSHTERFKVRGKTCCKGCLNYVVWARNSVNRKMMWMAKELLDKRKAER